MEEGQRVVTELLRDFPVSGVVLVDMWLLPNISRYSWERSVIPETGESSRISLFVSLSKGLLRGYTDLDNTGIGTERLLV